jgi:vancomycin resistance protein YoaR
VLGALVLGATAGVAGAAVDTAHSGRALPAVHFENVPLGGLSQAEAKGVLDAHLNAFTAAPYVFVHGEREWRPTAAEVGIRVDSSGMAERAVQEGRTAPWPVRYFTGLGTFATRPAVPLNVTLDRTQLSAFLSAVAAEVDREPVNAALSIRNGQVVAGQSTQGRRVDIVATLERVAAPTTLTPQRVDVVVSQSMPALTDAAIQEAQATANRILASPLTLRLGERTWTMSPTQLSGMIEFRRTPVAEGERLVTALAEARVAAFVRTVAADIDRQAQNAQLRWNGSAVAVVRQSTDGVRLDQAAAVRAIIAQAPTDAREVALVTAISKPTVTSDAATLGSITHLVATGSSKFAGSSPERVNNIQVAASKLDGTVIPPGATFSFLKALGPITKENGFQEGLTIQGDATVPGIGGGVCQVSTTVFRAAFFAGLPIIERHQHTYRVSYYEQDGSPVGFDAAVYDPGVDLRFKNDTDHAILMHAQFDAKNTSLAFRFYSTPSGRDVKLTPTKANEIKAGPRLPDVPDPTLPKGTRKQLEWSADGVDTTIRRVVTAGGKTVASDAFFSRYMPWREKWAVGPG